MTRYDHFLRLLVAFGLILGGLLMTALLSIFVLLISGLDISTISQMNEQGNMAMSAGLTRALLATQHFFSFIIPALVFGLIYYGRRWPHGMDLGNPASGRLAALAFIFLIAAYPLVNLSFLLNESIPMPEWAKLFENQAEDTLKAILTMDTPWILLINLVIIAILPGIGEELIFRGILQKHVTGIFKNQFAGIWIAAFIFSAIHLQFEGFLPRFVLGALLGYLYYWTGNLWVPILVHAFNNGIQVILIYATDMDITSIDEQTSHQLQWWMIPLSVGLMYLIHRSMVKKPPTLEPI